MAPPPVHVFKIVVTGPFAAGKTTFIQTVVDREFLTMSASTSSSDESSVKHQTTVGMDFGSLTLADPEGDIELRVYGTPGQERFSFMWEVLAEGADGYVLVVDGTDPASWEAALAHHQVMARVGIPGVVAANRCSSDTVGPATDFFQPLGLAVLPCQATDPDAVRTVLVAALIEVLDLLDDEPLEPLEPLDPPDPHDEEPLDSDVLQLSGDARRP